MKPWEVKRKEINKRFDAVYVDLMELQKWLEATLKNKAEAKGLSQALNMLQECGYNSTIVQSWADKLLATSPEEEN